MSLFNPTTSLLIKRGVRRGWLTLLRERGWMTSLGALLGVVLLVQLLTMLWMGAGAVDHLLRVNTDVRLPIQAGVADRQVQEFLVALRQLPAVDEVTYVTREQAYETERLANPALVEFLEQFDIANPFPDTVGVRLRNLAEYDAFLSFVRQQPWERVVDPTFLSQASDQRREMENMLGMTAAGAGVVRFFLFVTTLVLLATVVELVRRRVLMRSDEIFVERLSGAREAALVLPFAVEAAILLAIAFLLSVAVLSSIAPAVPFFSAFSPDGPLALLQQEILAVAGRVGPWLLMAEIAMIPAVAWVGAYLGTRGGQMRLAA